MVVVFSFVARFEDPLCAGKAIEHLRDLCIPSGALPRLSESEDDTTTVRAVVHRWDLRVVLDTVDRFGGQMISTERVRKQDARLGTLHPASA
jgi:hypothetical protein